MTHIQRPYRGQARSHWGNRHLLSHALGLALLAGALLFALAITFGMIAG